MSDAGENNLEEIKKSAIRLPEETTSSQTVDDMVDGKP
jgi:hypothetical protein